MAGTRNDCHVCSCSKLICHRDPPLAPAFVLFPSQEHSWVQSSSQGTILLFTQLENEKRFRAFEAFLPIFLFKNGGGKGITEICRRVSCSQGPGFSCCLHAGFQLGFTSTRHLCLPCALSSCPLPSSKPLGEDASIKDWQQQNPASYHFSVTHSLPLRNTGLGKGWGLLSNPVKRRNWCWSYKCWSYINLNH